MKSVTTVKIKEHITIIEHKMFVSLAFLVPKCNAVFFKLCMLSCNRPSRVKHFTKHNFSTMHILWLKQNYILKSQQHGFLFKGMSNKTELIQDSRTKIYKLQGGTQKFLKYGCRGRASAGQILLLLRATCLV